MTDIVLRTQDLTRRYGSLLAVDHLSLEIFAGEVFGLLGPNGAGKTTSISMVAGLLQPDQGEVWLRGQRVSAGSVEARARVGVCPQEIVIWKELTCLEQIVLCAQMYDVPHRAARARGLHLLDRLGLSPQAHHRARTLSGGMQRRLNLALALAHDPEILVLDEPEAGLDPQSRRLVREFIQSLARVKTVLLTTHNMDEAERVADRVAILDHGRLLAVDSPEALRHRVGAGDVLEISLTEPAPERLATLAGLVSGVSWADGTLTLRGPDLVGRMPNILQALSGLPLKGLRLRENTLEDAFIALTSQRSAS